jgi:hypothetical protein
MHLSQSSSLRARALDIPAESHPNRMPFSGVLTKINEPSDAAPEGSGGRRITLTMAAAKAALDSLLGMGVNYCPIGHAPQEKIGFISAAQLVGGEIHIEGFLYSADFPKITEEIKANKSKLGFSFEARDLITSSIDADPLPIVDLNFTGAAILLKEYAAYRSTSIRV